MTDDFTGWRKSTRSGYNGNCLAAGLKHARWRTSIWSKSDNCVEVGTGPAVVGVRDTKLADASPVLEFSADTWAALTSRLKTAPGVTQR